MSDAAEGHTVPEWHFGDRLRKARREAGLSQSEMAAALGVSPARLGNWEAGYNLPRELVKVAKKAAEVTGYSADWLLGISSTDGYRLTRDDVDVIDGTLEDGQRSLFDQPNLQPV